MVEHIRYNASDNPLIEKDFISHLNSSQAEFQIIVLRGLGQIKVENFNRITKLITPAEGVCRVWIPKPDGRKRPLGIPTIRDRVTQMAVLLVIEPIFEADFMDCSYGFRPGRSAHDALSDIAGTIKEGLTALYDADLKGYFDSIPHDKLISCLRMRIVDRSVLKLVRMWLQARIIEKDGKGGRKISRSRKGTPLLLTWLFC